MSVEFQYPPDLFSLLVDTIPLLCRSKQDVIVFFKGAGVPPTMTNDLVRKINKDKDSIKKYEIARTVLTRINEKGDSTLVLRREVVRRVVEFENFSSCWASDQLKAKGLVSEVRRLVNVKDSFTRMNQEREEERRKHQVERQAKQEEAQRRQAKLVVIKADLFSLFGETNSQKRGKALEGVLNRLFDISGILVRDAFTITGLEGEGIVEQIDGVIEIDSNMYLVEMKWWDKPLGTAEVSQHV